VKGSRTGFNGAQPGGFLDEAVQERQAVASFLKLRVVACNLAAQGADVFRVETKVLEGKVDCLGELQSRCPRIFMLTFREGGRRTMEVGWTEANQIAISSCTMPWGVRGVLLEVDSRIH
jgi:hypothetical protein